MTHEHLLQRDRLRVWHPAAQMALYAQEPPLIIDRADGVYLFTADGRRIWDGIASWWCKSLGHRHPRVVAALHQQIDRFEHHILAGATNEAVVRLVERWLVHANAPHRDWFSCGFFADNGSTGVEVALKMALQWQRLTGHGERTGFVTLDGAYHGETIGALSLTDSERYAAPFASVLFPVTRLRGLPLRSGPDDPAWQDAAAQWPAIVAQLETVARSTAAVVIEPVMQGAGGVRLYSPDLIRRLRAWCDAHGVLLIADEIASGCWRLGRALACHHAGVLPDLAIIAKGFTAGAVPGSMVLATACVAEAFHGSWASGRAFMHSNTFAGNALAVAAGHAFLDAIEHDGLIAHVAQMERHLRTACQHALHGRRDALRLRVCGMMAAFDLCQRDGSAWPIDQRRGWRTHRACLERDALLRPMGDSMYLMPPLTATADQLTELLGTLIAALDDVAATEMHN